VSDLHQTVARNQGYTKSQIGSAERHNERKNENYFNDNIIKDRQHLNVHFKQNAETYQQTFDRMIDEGAITTKGLKTDGTAKVFGELIFDVNSKYFEENGGYEFAKTFYRDAYQYACDKIGEQYILSAVMHADEINKGASEDFGKDVYHYHMHVTYIPVVEKEVLWSKRTKDKSLVGTVKEKINQVSHSKLWDGKTELRDGGEKKLTKGYSILQDEFHAHMKNAGYQNIERGQNGSDREHLSQLEYEKQQEQTRLEKTKAATNKQSQELDKITADIEKGNKVLATQAIYTDETNFIKQLGERKAGLTGKIPLDPSEHKRAMELVKQSFSASKELQIVRRKLKETTAEVDTLASENKQLKQELGLQQKSMKDKMDETMYQRAMEVNPVETRKAILELANSKNPERDHQRTKGRDIHDR